MRAANLRANQMQFSIRIGNLLRARTWLRAHPSAPMKIVSANNVRCRAKQRLDLRHHNRMGWKEVWITLERSFQIMCDESAFPQIEIGPGYAAPHSR